MSNRDFVRCGTDAATALALAFALIRATSVPENGSPFTRVDTCIHVSNLSHSITEPMRYADAEINNSLPQQSIGGRVSVSNARRCHPSAPMRAAFAAPAARTSPGCTVHARDGAALSVLATPASARKPTAVLLHDFMTDARLFAPLAARGPRGVLGAARLIRPDIRGFGRSPAPAGAYSRSDDLDDVLAALAVSGPVHLVGAGMGGVVALEYALAAPGRVRSVACVASGLPGHRWPTSAYLNIAAAQRVGKRASARGVSYLAEEPEDAGAGDAENWKGEFVARNEAWAAAFDPDAPAYSADAADALRDMVGAYSGFHFFHRNPLVPDPCETDPLLYRLKDVQAPVLAAVGAHETDDFTCIAREILDAVPNPNSADPAIIPGTGHFPTLQNPRAVSEALTEFWSSCP